MLGTLLGGLFGLGKVAFERLVPDRAKAQDQDHEARMGNMDINKSLAGHASIVIAFSVALTRYIISFLVIYLIAAAFFDLPIPEELTGVFKLLIPLIGL